MSKTGKSPDRWTFFSFVFSFFCFLSFFIVAVSPLQAAMPPGVANAAAALPEYSLTVSFDIQRHAVEGDAVIEVPPSGAKISLAGLRIKYLNFSGGAVSDPGGWLQISQQGRLEIKYERTFAGMAGGPNPLAEGAISGDMVGKQGIFLTGNWYPRLDGLAFYRLSALVPAGFSAVSEADVITHGKETPAGRLYSFDFQHPSQGMDLAASHFAVTKAKFGDVYIYTYLFPKDAGLAGQYIKYTEKYLALDEKLLAPYPYKRFSVVENIFPTGLSMPTFTLIGAVIIHFPFVLNESLGHEITHQWFGNWVYANFEKGNWLEAITVYMSDYRYARMRGKGRQYRKKALENFQSYVRAGNDFPLRRFYVRTNSSSEAIGYGKGMMFFHMLEKTVGHVVFYRALRTFIMENQWRQATWDDIKKVFERESGKRLGWLFSQWLDRTGVPGLKVEDAKFSLINGVSTVSLDIAQESRKPYRLPLDIKMLAGGRPIKSVTVQAAAREQKFKWVVGERPDRLVVDGGYQVMRRLSENEFPPLISRLLGSVRRIVIYSPAQKQKYAPLLSAMGEEGFSLKEETGVTDEDIRDSSILVLGPESPLLRRLFGKMKIKIPARGFIITVRRNPLNRRNVVAMAWGSSEKEVSLAAPLIIHYGGYSTLTFLGGKNTGKRRAASRNGITVRLTTPVPAAVSTNLDLDGVMNAVSTTPVIFIGERHTYYGDHLAELNAIMDLHGMGRKFAIGMEMFQRPFQKPINDFIAGKISERRFLKETQYFQRWGFNYDLYRPILEYARANGIPVIALNVRRGIENKVAEGGFEALSPSEKKEIPKSMDMSNERYRKELEKIYAVHPKGVTFRHFYQAQILWDETMAQSVARYLEKNPGSQMIVLAGEGHIEYGYGIPERFFRRTGKRYVTIINGSYGRRAADYVLFPEYEAAPEPPMLGIIAKIKKKEKGKKPEGGVEIEKVLRGSPAAKAGLRRGDRIVAIDNWEVNSIYDIKAALSGKKPGQKLTVTVERKQFLFKRHEVPVKVTL